MQHAFRQIFQHGQEFFIFQGPQGVVEKDMVDLEDGVGRDKGGELFVFIVFIDIKQRPSPGE